MRMMEEYSNEELSITWEQRSTNTLNRFLNQFPQYYNVLKELLTGGTRTAYLTQPHFEKLIAITKKINKATKVIAKRLKYHKSRTKQERDAAKKGKTTIDVKKICFFFT